jgi:hypothetical protein
MGAGAESSSRFLSIFRGRDRENNKAIIMALSRSRGGMTIWEITRAVLRGRLSKALPPNREPKALDVQKLYPTIFRCIKGSSKAGKLRTEGLESMGYVIEMGSKTSKGREVPVYTLTVKGSLAALLLNFEKSTCLKSFLENTASSNPFFEIALEMLNQGIDEHLIRELLNSWRDAICSGLLNLDVAEDGTISYVLLLKMQEGLIKMFETGLWTLESLEKASKAFRDSAALSRIRMQTKLDLAHPTLYLELLETQANEEEYEKIRLLKRIFESIQKALAE